MAEEKRYEVPEEMKKMMREWQACIELRDHCVESVFKAKKAIFYGEQAVKINNKFWSLLKELYPDMDSGHWSYDLDDHFVYDLNQREEN